jgi:hypothetical protein
MEGLAMQTDELPAVCSNGLLSVGGAKTQLSEAKEIFCPLVVAYGGGVNSTAMLIQMQREGIKPDLILFADTGGERPETYESVMAFDVWLQTHGMPGIITVRHQSKKWGDKTLEEECFRTRSLPSIAYGYKKCSLKWKKLPQDKYVNNWQPAKDCWKAGGKVRKAIGYDISEERRAGIPDDEKYTYEYRTLYISRSR